ncbi:MAG: succinate dehydrogenase, cytochrome b556 subunit [Pseudomonadota bacterium]
MTDKFVRPVFFNLLQIQMPVGALTSIAHRVSGICLALSIPAVVYFLDLSLQSPQRYAQVVGWFDHLAVRIGFILLIWSLSHHLLAGIRHLLMDIDAGSQLRVARRSALLVNIAGIVVALLAASVIL